MKATSKKPGVAETASNVARAIRIDQWIRDGRFLTAAQMAEELEVSRRTVFNTLDYMRYTLGAPIAYCRRRGGYYYTDPTYGLPAVFLTEGEVLAVLLAEHIARHYLGTPLEQTIRSAVEKIARYLPEPIRIELTDLAGHFVFGGSAALEVPLETMHTVFRAIRERHVLRMRYYTASRDEVIERTIEPHFLQNVGGDWMVVGWDRLRNEVRAFMLARIQECGVVPERFVPRADLQPASYRQHVFQTEHRPEPYRVLLRFDSYQARWIRERCWHPSQQIQDLPDGGLLLRLEVAGIGDLVRWILGYGSHVEVLEPDWLRDKVASEAEQAAALYRSPDGAAPVTPVPAGSDPDRSGS